MGKHHKREIPPMLKNILAIDVQLTEKLVKCIEKLMPLRQLKIHNTALEISCHGIPWIASILAFIWILDNKNLYQMQVNLLFGLLLDIIVIAILKAFFRRRRPVPTNDPFSVGPDKYSFPSGHVSRSVLIFYVFKYLWPVSVICLLPIAAWIFSLAMSRLLMRRHHILDICAGLILGYAEGMLLSFLYLDAKTCAYLVSWLNDAKVDGAEDDA
ncbi:polyisoprenoid diphosphate/phosphate phosphohydrolase PLPP6 [Osmia lignaria lignaria]|uniref:polyisoprenoid diphosphate/phosphate phosphohydrolase PLPP6 n=1 Tax=Osmia lignaria lignaria TaxID=1437193 RepID=UPI0014794C9E|nr:phospholipid phosphatase 6 [Osmia lignaria]